MWDLMVHYKHFHIDELNECMASFFIYLMIFIFFRNSITHFMWTSIAISKAKITTFPCLQIVYFESSISYIHVSALNFDLSQTMFENQEFQISQVTLKIHHTHLFALRD
jgi:hypothetical protein